MLNPVTSCPLNLQHNMARPNVTMGSVLFCHDDTAQRADAMIWTIVSSISMNGKARQDAYHPTLYNIRIVNWGPRTRWGSQRIHALLIILLTFKFSYIINLLHGGNSLRHLVPLVVFYGTYSSLPYIQPSTSQRNSVHAFKLCLFEIYYIIFPFMPSS